MPQIALVPPSTRYIPELLKMLNIHTPSPIAWRNYKRKNSRTQWDLELGKKTDLVENVVDGRGEQLQWEVGCESGGGAKKKHPTFHSRISQLMGYHGHAARNFSLLTQGAGQNRVQREGETKMEKNKKEWKVVFRIRKVQKQKLLGKTNLT